MFIARALPLLALAVCALAQECSTEKVNDNCILLIDRLYPVTPPTIQMRRGKTMTVKVAHPLQFETLTLDPQSAQAIAGTDQTAGLLTAMIPYAKNFVAESQQQISGVRVRSTPPLGVNPTPEELVEADLNNLDEQLQKAEDYVAATMKNIFPIYLQLQEIVSPLPRPLVPVPGDDRPPTLQSSPAGSAPEKPSKADKNQRYTVLRPIDFPPDTPNPWERFEAWRQYLLCELNGQYCGARMPVINILGSLAHAPLPAAQNNKLTWTPFDNVVTDATTIINTKLPKSEQNSFNQQLAARLTRESNLTASVNLLSKIQQDLTSYSQNIELVGTVAMADPQNLGVIYDPNCAPNVRHCPKSLRLGTQTVFAVNTVNQIAVLPASVVSASQKKSIATITVLYADPIFEVSTGVFFSSLPNRSFANQTLIVQGTPPTQGNVVIGQTIVRPTIVPFAAANWRLGHDALWMDGRRRAWYFSTAIGLNPNNTMAEFGFGPSVSWRALMFSGLFHLGHDVQLTQGEYLGEIWCNQTAKTCSPSPPNPTTEKHWTPAFAFGIGIRIPTMFGGTGR